jgi:hypothetical protein
MQRISKTKSWFFENINMINKPLANLTKRRREKTQINKIRDEKVSITMNAKEIQKFIRKYFQNLYLNNLENPEEMDTSLDAFDLPKSNQEYINHLHRVATNNEIIVVTESPNKEKDPMDSLPNSTKSLKTILYQHSSNFLVK